MRKTNREKQKLKRAERRWQKEIQKRFEEGEVPPGCDRYELCYSKAYAGSPRDLGELLYSYSDARTWVDFPKKRKLRKILTSQRVFLVAFAALLCVWFLTALIYQLCTTTNADKTLLHLLPTFIVVAVCTAILLISAGMAWGKFLRWAFKHHLVRGRDAASWSHLMDMKTELERADSRKTIENALDVTTDYVVLKIWGAEYVLYREYVTAEVTKTRGKLSLKLYIAGKEKDFPVTLPEEEYVPLKKALRGQLTAVRNNPPKDKDLPKKILREIPAFFMFLVILGAGVMVIVAHYLWIPEIPPFLGVFFIGASFLALCNILSFLPAVNAVGLPLIFSIILMVIPPWAIVWFQQNVFHSSGNIIQIILQCDVFTVGFSFFTIMGVYAFIFAITKLIDYIRFGAKK